MIEGIPVRALEVLYLIYCQGMTRTKVSWVLSEMYNLPVTKNRVIQLEERGLKCLAKTDLVSTYIKALFNDSQEELAKNWAKIKDAYENYHNSQPEPPIRFIREPKIQSLEDLTDISDSEEPDIEES